MAAPPDPKAKSTSLMTLALGLMSLAAVVLVGLLDDAATTFVRIGLSVALVNLAVAMGMVYHARYIASRSWPESPGSATSS